MAHIGPSTREEYGDGIHGVVGPVGEIPTLPAIATKLLAMIDDPDSSAADVARVIAGDPALAANLLRVANSAYFGVGRRIGSVTDAIVFLGLNGVRQLALAISVIGAFGRASGGERLDYARVWRHSIQVAAAGRNMAVRANLTAETAFLSCLLHDIGRIILSRSRPIDYAQVEHIAMTEQVLVYEAESRVFGCDHSEVGAFAMDSWNLPPVMIHACRYHHEPGAEKPDWPATAVVHAADVIMWELTAMPEVPSPTAMPNVVQFLGLSPNAMEDIKEKAEEEAEKRWASLTP